MDDDPAVQTVREPARQFLSDGTRVAAVGTLGGLIGLVSGRSSAEGTVWPIDPQKCVRCGNEPPIASWNNRPSNASTPTLSVATASFAPAISNPNPTT